jgi:uncharacterized repeat protein (TIGR01451 family)
MAKRGPSSAVSGELVTFTLSVGNSGPYSATNVIVSDPLPSGFDFSSAGPDCTYDAGTVTCTAPTLGVNSSIDYSLQVTVTSSITDVITNEATATADEHELDPENNSDTHSISVSPSLSYRQERSLPRLAYRVLDSGLQEALSQHYHHMYYQPPPGTGGAGRESNL